MTTENAKTKVQQMADMVNEMHVAFEMNPPVDLALSLVKEEAVELLEAMSLDLTDDTPETLENVLKEGCDLAYVYFGAKRALAIRGLMFQPEVEEEIIRLFGEIVAAFGDEKFFEAFSRVHASNMSKLGEDGKPVRREDGKVLKGPNYVKPVLTDLVLEAYLKGARPANETPA
jgi:hypothetical protein